MNEYDSSRMVDLMQEAYGLRLVADPADADVILMNTCSVREKAEEKVYSELGRYRLIKKWGKEGSGKRGQDFLRAFRQTIRQ